MSPSWIFPLINTFEGRYRLALVFIQGGMDNVSVLNIDVRFGRIVLERECVLHPMLIIALLWDQQNLSTRFKIAQLTSG